MFLRCITTPKIDVPNVPFILVFYFSIFLRLSCDIPAALHHTCVFFGTFVVSCLPYSIGSMYGNANIWGILMGSMLPYIAHMDPMGI